MTPLQLYLRNRAKRGHFITPYEEYLAAKRRQAFAVRLIAGVVVACIVAAGVARWIQ